MPGALEVIRRANLKDVVVQMRLELKKDPLLIGVEVQESLRERNLEETHHVSSSIVKK